MATELKDNSLLFWKGYSWSKLFKLDPYHLSRLAIQVSTLSRFTHSAYLTKYKKKWYLIQSNFVYGTHIVEVYVPWLENEIKEGNILQVPMKKKPIWSFEGTIEAMYENRLERHTINKYNVRGVLNQFFWQVFGKDLLYFKTPNVFAKQFCSEFNYCMFTESPDSYRIAPVDLLFWAQRYRK